jgi:uncharacterized protein (TIGR03067 family)
MRGAIMNICYRYAATAILVLGCLNFAPFPASADESTAKDKRKLELKDLRGRWLVDHFSSCDAKTGEVEDLLGKLKHELIITDENIVMEIEKIKFFEWKVAYDLTKKPARIDLVGTFPRNKEEKLETKGVLELKGDDLVIHLAEPNSETRPSDFQQKKGLSSMLIKCKREK